VGAGEDAQPGFQANPFEQELALIPVDQSARGQVGKAQDCSRQDDQRDCPYVQ